MGPSKCPKIDFSLFESFLTSWFSSPFWSSKPSLVVEFGFFSPNRPRHTIPAEKSKFDFQVKNDPNLWVRTFKICSKFFLRSWSDGSESSDFRCPSTHFFQFGLKNVMKWAVLGQNRLKIRLKPLKFTLVTFWAVKIRVSKSPFFTV